MEMKRSIKITAPNFQSMKSEDLKEIIGGVSFSFFDRFININRW